jgi:hypothetical protein
MGFLDSFKKGIQKAKNDVEGIKPSEKFGFAEMKTQILDKNMEDSIVVISLKKFLDGSLDAVEKDQALELFIKERPEARDKLLNI